MAERLRKQACGIDDDSRQALGSRTAEQAIAAGLPMREIWLAICDAQDVPENRRYGVGQREPKK